MISCLTTTLSFWMWEFFGRLHPAVVHFPVALLSVAMLVELYQLLKKKDNISPTTDLLLKIGTASALVSVVFGLLLANQNEAEGELVDLHQWAGIATFLLALAALLLRYKISTTIFRCLVFLSGIGVSIAGHYGAMLTHGENYLTDVLPFGQEDAEFTGPTGEAATITLAAFQSDTLDEKQISDLNLQVRTILAHSCYNCHSESKTKGGLRLDSKEAIFKGGESGPLFVTGNASKSELIRRITLPNGHKELMPTKGKRLSDEEVALLKLWIDKGAPWPEKEQSVYRIAALEPRLPELPIAEGVYTKEIDRFVNAYFKSNNIQWQQPVEDAIYIRRVYLDLIGLLPSPEEISAFKADSRPDKREQLVTSLLARNEDYTQHWLTFWNDLLRNDYSGTGYITGGRSDITKWLYNSLQTNKPYNWFVKELISPTQESEGFIKGIKWRGTINSSQSTEMQAAQNVAQVFMGLNLKCASCHDSFISDWKLEDAYGFASIFSESPLEINRCDLPTGKIATSKMLFPELGNISQDAPTKEKLKELAEYLTQPKDGRLYRTLSNRIWAQLMGRGIIEPVDEMDNMPWSEDLLDWLAYDFAASGYDIKKLLFKITTSQIYQQPSISINSAEELSKQNFVFQGMIRRRLSAEQFSDAISQSFMPLYSNEHIAVKRLPESAITQAPFPRASLVINNAFLTALGRPNREMVSTSRLSQANLLQALELTNGDLFYAALKNGSVKWKQEHSQWDSLLPALYSKMFGRVPTEEELKTAKKILGETPTEEGVQDLVWSMALSPEFQLIF